MNAPPALSRHASIAAAVIAGLLSAAAPGDGGAVVCAQQVGDLRVTVLMSPARPAAGPVEFSVLVRDANGAPRSDIAVNIEAEHASSAQRVSSAALPEASRNAQLASAWLDLEESGEWELRVRLAPASGVTTDASVVMFRLPIAAPAESSTALSWLWAAGVGLLVLGWREVLLRRQVPH